ncbi:Protein CtaG [Geodia barretti]|uniref:Protein CtaG n=1 Tax=Geodia barretti TaxID=519541 RepID=A0AA35TXH7_GEOBA|nr:Protein CtaG [Geodia barretti]
MAGLALLLGVYLVGVGPLRERYKLADHVDPRQLATFCAGIVVIFFALASPLHVLSERFLFSMHMSQHVLLTLIAPPLLVLGTPDWLIRPLLRPNWSFRVARVLTHPVTAFAAFNVVFSVWHIPALYNTSLNSEAVHALEHIMMVGTAVLMWWPLTSNLPELPRLDYPFQMGYIFILSIAQIIVFAIITFAKEPLYDFYVQAPRIWSLSPLLDQQLGGIIMKVGSGIYFLVLLIVIFYKWFNQEEAVRKLDSERTIRQ